MAKSDNKVISLEDLHKLSAEAMHPLIKLALVLCWTGVSIVLLASIGLVGVHLWLN
jgi:hypothetical protein